MLALIPVFSGYDTDPPEAPVESAGIKLGEIIAWRAWRVKHGWLYSMVADQEWEPGKVIEADEIGQPKDKGVHAFKRRLDVIEEYGSDIEFYDIAIDMTARRSATVVGRVALWGTIYEFEKGWHGEYAKIHSLDFMPIRADEAQLPELRQTYQLSEAAE